MLNTDDKACGTLSGLLINNHKTNPETTITANQTIQNFPQLAFLSFINAKNTGNKIKTLDHTVSKLIVKLFM